MVIEVIDFVRNLSGSDWWRIVNVCMCIHAIILLSIQVFYTWKLMSGRMRLLAQSHIALLAAFSVRSIESMLQNNPVGFGTAVLSAGVFWTLLAMLATPNENYGETRT